MGLCRIQEQRKSGNDPGDDENWYVDVVMEHQGPHYGHRNERLIAT